MENPSPLQHTRPRGLSLIELLVALAITAMLLTATMLAIDASFKAYAAAAESASTQTTTRLVINRVLALIRTKTAQGPLEADPANAVVPSTEDDGRTLSSNHLILQKNDDSYIRIQYDPDTQRLMLQRGNIQAYNPTLAQPLLGGVTQCEFRLHPRYDSEGVLVLDRASIDFTVTADDDATLELEKDTEQSIRVVASTMPRRLE